jgi:hypothetical protein
MAQHAREGERLEAAQPFRSAAARPADVGCDPLRLHDLASTLAFSDAD